jgi:hypothetical protein
MKNRVESALVAVASLVFASSVSAQISNPYFDFTGGDLDAEMTVPAGNFIPAGALEFDSAVVNGTPQPVTVVLRDPGFDGAPRTVCVDYIGTDAGFQNRFYISGTTINWCNKTSCADPTATPLGIGNGNWTGPFTASACFQMNVGQAVPFVFVGDVLNSSGSGPRIVGNGQAIANEHWGLFPYPFVFSAPLPTQSAIVGVGLADGFYNPAVDDDHQDFTVRFTALPGPTPAQNIPTLGEWAMIVLASATAAIGLRYVRRVEA